MNFRKNQLQLFFFLLFVLSNSLAFAQESKNFSTLNEVLEYAKSKNILFQNAKFQNQLAALAKKTSVANVINPRLNSNVQILDNLSLPTSYLPAEAFGGPTGTYKEVQIGLQYVSTFSMQAQFDLVNLASLAQTKSSKTNELLVENQNQIDEKNLNDRINAIYFNILSFNAQKEIISENLAIAENILKVINQKYVEGVARKQEANEAEVNLISLKDKSEQLDINCKIQYEILDLILENGIKSALTQSLWEFEKQQPVSVKENSLSIKNIALQTLVAKQEYKSLKYLQYPNLSLISAFNWQNLSNNFFFANKSKSQNFNYIGLKLAWDFPTVQRISNLKSKQLELQNLETTVAHIKKEAQSKRLQLNLEYEKAIKQFENSKKIFELKSDTYEKNYNQFKENILPLDKLLSAQNDRLLSKLNMIIALANIGFNENKIQINNNF